MAVALNEEYTRNRPLRPAPDAGRPLITSVSRC